MCATRFCARGTEDSEGRKGRKEVDAPRKGSATCTRGRACRSPGETAFLPASREERGLQGLKALGAPDMERVVGVTQCLMGD